MALDSADGSIYHLRALAVNRKDDMPMRREYVVRISVLVLLGAALTGGSSAVAQPTPLDITEAGIAGGLNAQQIGQVDAWLNWWKDKIANATEPKDVIDARKGILRNDYALVPTAAYQDEYARRAGVILPPLLTGGLKADDKLLRFKQINVGIVLSKMPQHTIQPALEVLVQNPNAAVRYLGWSGYHSARRFILAQGPLDVRKMFQTLEPAAGKETTAPVIGMIFVMCNIAPSGGAEVPSATLKDAQKGAAKIVEANWSRWCARIVTGDIEVTRAFEKGIATVKTLTPAGGSAAEKGKGLQLLIELMKYAAEGYDAVDGKGMIGKENAAVLKQCEAALVSISQKNIEHVKKVLTDKNIADRGAAVLRAVIKCAGELKAFGVVKPKVRLSATRPTTP